MRRPGRRLNLFHFLVVPQELCSDSTVSSLAMRKPCWARFPHGVGFEQADLVSHSRKDLLSVLHG